MDYYNLIALRLSESIKTKEKILDDASILKIIANLARTIIHCLKSGGKVLLCGNGGSASDALHIAGEITGRFQREREAWPAIALNADVATMTAIANDYGYDMMFARQVSGQMNSRDVLIGFTTSGNSKNVCAAMEEAIRIGGKVAVFTGRDGGRASTIADYSIIVPSDNTARIQESHITIGHILCEIIENGMTDDA